MTRRSFWRCASLPARLAVIGAGVIGSEYACTFATLGVEVHLIDGRPSLLPFLDGEIAGVLREAMVAGGVTFHFNELVKRCDVSGARCGPRLVGRHHPAL